MKSPKIAVYVSWGEERPHPKLASKAWRENKKEERWLYSKM